MSVRMPGNIFSVNYAGMYAGMYAGICIFENGLLYHVFADSKNALPDKLHACVTKPMPV